MPLDMGGSIGYTLGDGILDDQYQVIVNLPATDGGTAIVEGAIFPAAGMGTNGLPIVRTASPIPISASVVLPVAPASGTTYFAIQVDGSGAVTLKSGAAIPVADPGARLLTTQSLIPGQTNPALVGDATEPVTTPATP